MDDLTLLQAMRLKRRLSEDAAAACAGLPPDTVRESLAALERAGDASDSPAGHRLTAAGKARLTELLDVERRALDTPTLQGCYDGFTEANTRLKELITAWQMRDPQTPNDHLDDAYDRAIVGRLAQHHAAFEPLLDTIIGTAPRLGPYRGRFAFAVACIGNGDHAYVARPIIDSYHTVWFELHEELIGLLGLNRVDEAAAGRAL